MSKQKRDYILFIEDVLTCIEKIERYTSNVSFEDFSANDMAVDAVIRNFEIIGEAVKEIPEEIKKRYADVEWKEAVGFREVLIHDYFGIDIEAVSDTVRNNIPPFKKQILNVLESERGAKNDWRITDHALRRMSQLKDKTVCIVGLGYVGLPLAQAFSTEVKVIGYDIDATKIAELNSNGPNVEFTADPSLILHADIVIIAVPTPVTISKEPDLRYVKSAVETVGKNLKCGATVVLESTVYPGVTEEVVAPILETESNMKCGIEFYIGYSPERINPGDEAHDLRKITKIVAGMDEDTTERLAALYGMITNVYKAKDIRTAEAAKVIENIQRDLNIALMNELAIIFQKLGLETDAILAAAATKWNFQHYMPGLVGGHCIPVDPYYLVYKAKALGYHPQVILAGRAINDYMPKHVAEMAIKGLNEVGKVIKGSKVLIMGLTYKENVPDTRESPVKAIVKELNEFGIDVYGYDPLLSRAEIEGFGVKAFDTGSMKIDGVIVAVAHDEFKKKGFEDIRQFMNEMPALIDVRGIFDAETAKEKGIYYRGL